MTTLVLNDNLLRINRFRGTWRTQFYRTQTASLINLARSNGAARFSVRMSIFTLNDIEKNYVEGVILAAYYNNDAVQFTLPSEFFVYNGAANASGVDVRTTALGGSNTIQLVRGGASQANPASSELYQGGLLQFENDTTLYRINSYDSSTGTAIIFPTLRKTLLSGNSVEHVAPTITAHITSDPRVNYIAGNNSHTMYNLRLEEAL